MKYQRLKNSGYENLPFLNDGELENYINSLLFMEEHPERNEALKLSIEERQNRLFSPKGYNPQNYDSSIENWGYSLFESNRVYRLKKATDFYISWTYIGDGIIKDGTSNISVPFDDIQDGLADIAYYVYNYLQNNDLKNIITPWETMSGIDFVEYSDLVTLKLDNGSTLNYRIG